MNKIGIIYKLYFIGSTKIYIGSSQNYKRRIKNHIKSCLKDKHANKLIQRAFRKYGEENFRSEILETLEVLDTDLLLQREEFWINELKSYDRNFGYNIDRFPTQKSYFRSRQGRSMGGRCARGENNVQAKTYNLYNPEGTLISIKNLKYFCEENNLDAQRMRGVAQGLIIEYRGWRLDLERQNKMRYKISCSLVNSEGDTVYIDDLFLFCQKNKLNYTNLRKLITRNVKYSQGFKKLTIDHQAAYHDGPIFYTIQHNDGRLVEIKCLKQFCEDNHLIPNNSGKKLKSGKGYDGWKMIKAVRNYNDPDKNQILYLRE